jgi:hypothetical protein
MQGKIKGLNFKVKEIEIWADRSVSKDNSKGILNRGC